jgi:pyruvate/2-oxoglutarate dehydrogenase complex dihydrolipoamide acyltransferase (E2) component
VATAVTMPVLGLTMEEGTVAEWLKREGDTVQQDEPLLTVEMDKGTVEVPSPAGGVLRRIVVQPGTTVPVKTLIAEIDSGMPARMFVTPRARLRAREMGVELASLRGSGPNGRIVEADVLAATPAPPTPAPVPAVVQPGVAPLTRVRRITAERMAASAQATARVSLFLEADFTDATRFRNQLQPEFERLGVPKLPWDAIILKAAALALLDHQALLSQWTDTGLRTLREINIGVAVALEPEGLVVPVLRAADKRSLRELAVELIGVVERARSNRISPTEMQDGTFSITNLGAYRIDGFTPIINPPETAILGVGRIVEKAVVVEGKLEVRTLCTLSLSFDHRVVDGVPAAAFLARLAELLERPYTLLGI